MPIAVDQLHELPVPLQLLGAEVRIEVLAGVKSGDLVALTDVDNLADGMKVAAKRK